MRTGISGEKIVKNHNQALRVRTTVRAGGHNLNHNEVLRVRTTLRGGKIAVNHNEAQQA
jgi:hypothetical protein